MLTGPRLALSWLTVLPVRGPETVDRSAAARAITWTPVVGALLGAVAALILWGAASAGLAYPLGGVLAVSALALLTRGMHIDGLADTADGLGCYGPPERAREVMRSGSAGPFGVAAIALVLGIQALSFGQLAQQSAWISILLVVITARVAVVLTCRRGVLAATDTGFGALVAGTQSRLPIVLWCAATLLASVWCVPSRPWQGPIVVLIALTGTVALAAHCTGRFGGISGDVLGATIETVTAATAVGLLLGS